MNRKNNLTYIFSTNVLHMAMSVSVLQLTGKLCNTQKTLVDSNFYTDYTFLYAVTYLQMTVVTDFQMTTTSNDASAAINE